MKFLVLWSHVSDYLLAQLNGLKEMGGEVHLVCFTKSPDAPFDESYFHSKLSSFSQSETYTAEEILRFTNEIKPDVILVSSWHIKPYTNVLKKSTVAYYAFCVWIISGDSHFGKCLVFC